MCEDRTDTAEERLNKDKQTDKKIKRHRLFAPSQVVLVPLSIPQFHLKTEVRIEFIIVLGRKLPSVSVKKARGMDGWTDRQVEVTVIPNEPMEGDVHVHGAPVVPRY